jgi:hypothetical protein
MARGTADLGRRFKIGPMAVVLALAALLIQCLVAFRFFLYCDENLIPGTSREMVCRAADDGGYLTGILLPPVSVLAGGLVAHRRKRVGILVAVFALALVIGIAVPMTIGLAAGYR